MRRQLSALSLEMRHEDGYKKLSGYMYLLSGGVIMRRMVIRYSVWINHAVGENEDVKRPCISRQYTVVK